MVTYRYALGRSGILIDVGNLNEAIRRYDEPYRCLGCGDPLIARLPKSGIANHFAHRSGVICSGETYLHALAKRKFVDAYRRATSQGSAFVLRRTIQYTCRYFEQYANDGCHRSEVEEIDLTKYFDRCEVESKVGNFIGDVVLFSTESDHQVLVEFAVTHHCTPEKIKSGLRIVEIEIHSENDVEESLNRIDGDASNVNLHNFRIPEYPEKSCGGKCNASAMVLSVDESGKARLEVVVPEELPAYFSRSNAAHVRGIGLCDFDPPAVVRSQVFQDGVLSAHRGGVYIRNCYLCRYHGVGWDKAIFCKVKKKEVSSNFAVQCDIFRT